MSSKLPAVVYAKQVIGGVLVRPQSRSVLEKAIQGHPIEIASSNDYINLYHVFERMQQSDPKRLGSMRLVRVQKGAARWEVFVIPEQALKPEVELLPMYDPRRGRYKRYAERLAAGETLDLAQEEAIKARRAWQLYVPAENRRHLRSTVKRVPRTGLYRVLVMAR